MASRVTLQIRTDLYHRHFYQFKTGVRMRLTSSVKKLEGFLQKLIKFEPGLIQVDDNEKHGVSKPAMRIPTLTLARRRGSGLCTGLSTKRNEICSHKN